MATEWQKLVCSTCGGTLEEKNGKFVCAHCKSTYQAKEKISEAEVIALNSATVDRNRYRFDDAQEKYDLLLKDYPDNAEANWGAFLCSYGIIYEEDYDGAFVPTCHRLSERPVEKSPYYAKLTAAQKKRAKGIEALRLKILEETKKIKPYDVFICYKQNEEKNGVTVPTRESKWARDIYDKLTNKYKLRVFFAEKSLSGSNADYEPHIYAALRSAKLMFVLTTSLEHLNSVWVANEWKRYLSYIRAGEDKTVRVVYDNVEPYDFPKELQSKQMIDQDTDWMAAVEAAVADIKRVATLDRIEIQGGQMAKKSATILTETLQTREIGVGVADTTVSEKQVLEIIQEYLSAEQWKVAEQMADGILYSNSVCAEALWFKFLARHKAYKDTLAVELARKIGFEDIAKIEEILKCCGKQFATEILSVLYAVIINSTKEEERLLQVILPYNYAGREKMIELLFKVSIKNGHYRIFKQLLATLQSSEVDTYIQYNLDFARNTQKLQDKKSCLNCVLGVDEGNAEAIRELIFVQLKEQDLKNTLMQLQKLLSYSKNGDKEIAFLLSKLTNELENQVEKNFAKELLKYYQGSLKNIKVIIRNFAYKLIAKECYEDALYFLELILSFEPDDAQAFWGICLVKTQAKTEVDIVNSNIPLSAIPEYTKYLTLVSATRRQTCIQLTKSQEEAIDKRKRDEEAAAIKKTRDAKRNKVLILSWVLVALGLTGCGTCTGLVVEGLDGSACMILGVIGTILFVIGGIMQGFNADADNKN